MRLRGGLSFFSDHCSLITRHFSPSSALGLVAQHGSLTALEFSRILDLPGESRLREWLGSLVERGIVLSKGKTRATTYTIQPDFLRTAGFSGATTLRSIEPHRLRELLLIDLATHSPDVGTASGIVPIHQRIGPEIRRSSIKATLDQMRSDGVVGKISGGRHSAYHLTESGQGLLKPKPHPNQF